MELHDYLAILRKQWVVITVVTVLGATVGLALALTGTPTYAATAKVFVSTTSGGSAAELAQGNSFTMQRVETYADLVTTAAVLDPTAESLGLAGSGSSIRGRLSASSPADTTIIDVTATGTDPESTAALATAAAEQLILVVEDWEQPSGAADSPVALWIAQPAEVPGAPQGASAVTSAGVGAFIGLCLGIAAALLLTVLDTRLRTQRDVARISTAPVLASIPFDPRTPSRPVQVVTDSQGRNAEAYRALRTNLEFVQGGKSGAPVLLTSSVPGEGKTTTAVNLAIALAHSGSRVLLIEADLRRPRVGRTLGIESGVGVSDVLVGRVTVEDATQPWGDDGLEVLAAGAIPPNPAELLGSDAMQVLLDIAASEYDHVIVDAPPLLAVTDAAVLARMVSKVMVVVGIGRARSPELRHSLASLANVGAAPAGIVMSMVPTRGPDAYSYTYGGYAYAPDPEERPSLLQRSFRRFGRAAFGDSQADGDGDTDGSHVADDHGHAAEDVSAERDAVVGAQGEDAAESRSDDTLGDDGRDVRSDAGENVADADDGATVADGDERRGKERASSGSGRRRRVKARTGQ